MATARDALNEIKWNQHALDRATIYYVHRGAPDDTAAAHGRDVLALRHSFFDLRDGASIPYHRVLKIEVASSVVWERARPATHGPT